MSRPKPSSRANGRLSKGPKTQEGKDRSKRNALRHGLLARDPAIVAQPGDGFDQLLQQHVQTLRPQSPVDSQLVADMSSACWQLHRLRSIENSLLATEDATPAGADPTDQLVAAFSRLVHDGSYQLLQRYEARLHGVYHRAIQTLVEARLAKKT